jgi:acyl dehydratase
MSGRAVFDGIEVGDVLRPEVRVPTREQLVRYAGAAHDFSAIHFDDENARSRGFDRVIVHGLLKAAYLGDMLESWSAPHGWVQKISTQYRGVDFPGEPMTCHAHVLNKSIDRGQGAVDFDLWIESARGQTTTRGTATVVLELESGAVRD